MKSTISKEEYLQLEGLLALAHRHKKIVDECQTAMENLTGEDNDIASHSGDVIWEDGNIKELLRRLKIKITNPL